MTTRTYYGWIFMEKSPGMKDNFSVQWFEDGNTQTRNFGYGETGAARSVEFFEVTQKLGRISLEKTPLGLRVYKEEEVEINEVK